VTKYAIQFFNDDSLPLCRGGMPDWVFIRTSTGDVILYIHEDAVTPEVLTDAWAAYRDMEPALPRLPLQLARRTAGLGGAEHG
jgi:hypothetical protein